MILFNHEVIVDVTKAVLKKYLEKGRIAFFGGRPVQRIEELLMQMPWYRMVE